MKSKILKSTTRDMIKAPHRAVKSRLAAGGYLQVRTLWGKKKKDKNPGKQSKWDIKQYTANYFFLT